MNFIKKSFNLENKLAEQLEQLIKVNPHLSLTLVLNQALSQWLKNPKIEFNAPKKFTGKDVDDFMDENSTLMDNLGNETKSSRAS